MTTTAARRHVTWLALTSAGLASVLGGGPAVAYEPPGGLRDVREFACPPGSTPDAEFADVPERDPFRLEISCLAALGITRGTSGGVTGAPTTFSPGQTVPRFVMALLLARTVLQTGVELPQDQPAFTDLDGIPDEAVRAIGALTRAGIVQGVSATQFAPLRDVTREELASLVVRTQAFLAPSGVGEPFAAGPDRFTDGISTTHRDAVNALAAGGIVTGTGPTTFEPRGSVTRSQVAAFLTRFVDRLDEAEPDVSARSRNNEELSDRFLAMPPAGSRPAVADRGGANDLSDDTVYTISGLVPGREYRITLVTTDSYVRAEGGPVDNSGESGRVVFNGSSQTFLAAPGTTSAVVLDIDGAPVAEPSRSVTHTPTGADGTFTFRVDAEDATAVAPFVYPNQSYDYTSYDPRLELAADLRPVEVFGVGPVATYTSPSVSPLR